MTTTALRRVATYERTSSEDQRDRETIKTQSEGLAQRLGSDPTAQLVFRFIDDGISGTIPMGERPQGRKPLQAAKNRELTSSGSTTSSAWAVRRLTCYSSGGDLSNWVSAL
jgi:hypothetical protein